MLNSNSGVPGTERFGAQVCKCLLSVKMSSFLMRDKQNPSWKLESTFSNPASLKTNAKAVPVAALTHSDLLSQRNSVLTVCL